jgi:hypothetical protein
VVAYDVLVAAPRPFAGRFVRTARFIFPSKLEEVMSACRLYDAARLRLTAVEQSAHHRAAEEDRTFFHARIPFKPRRRQWKVAMHARKFALEIAMLQATGGSYWRKPFQVRLRGR